MTVLVQQSTLFALNSKSVQGALMCEKLLSFLYFSEMRGAIVVSHSHEPTTFTKRLHPHRSTRFPSSLGSSPTSCCTPLMLTRKSDARPSHQRLLLVPTATPHLTNRRLICVRTHSNPGKPGPWVTIPAAPVTVKAGPCCGQALSRKFPRPARLSFQSTRHRPPSCPE